MPLPEEEQSLYKVQVCLNIYFLKSSFFGGSSTKTICGINKRNLQRWNTVAGTCLRFFHQGDPLAYYWGLWRMCRGYSTLYLKEYGRRLLDTLLSLHKVHSHPRVNVIGISFSCQNLCLLFIDANLVKPRLSVII